MKEPIRVRGARQHNLKGIDVEIPRGSLTLITGPSGSGKSSLAFDTIYAEGQRRYVESLSTYAKQFLERMEKPAVDWIEGVSPSVAIDQRNSVQSSRSTVGTISEAYDFMRLLWARVGRTVCPGCQTEVQPDTVASAADRILALGAGRRVYVAFPFRFSDRVSAELAVANLLAQGYLRVIVDGRETYLPDLGPEGQPADRLLGEERELLVLVDRLRVDAGERERLTDSLAAAFAEGEGHALALVLERTSEGDALQIERRLSFSEAYRCPDCGRDFPVPGPLLFSFNNPAGACPECNGFGATLEYDPGLIVPDPGRSLQDGAIDPWTKPRYRRERAELEAYARRQGIDAERPWRDLPDGLRNDLLHGNREFQGVLPFLRSRERKRYKPYIRVFLRQYQLPRACGSCGGTRLRPEALNVRLGGLHIAEAAGLGVAALHRWLSALRLSPFELGIGRTVLRELDDRLRFMNEVGLGYLTLERQARTLSGGEMQRLRLASALASHLVDTLYVLDEPTIGLHPRDVERFLGVAGRLRDLGNTVLVVEHDPAVLSAADRILELGPGSGEGGGELVFEGSWASLLASGTLTGRALRAPFSPPAKRRSPRGALSLRGGRLHNLRGIDVDLPLGVLTVVTGVSGSGKSTLVHDLLYRALERELRRTSSAKLHLGERIGSYDSLEGTSALDDVVLVDQAPIGRTPRSNPVTYIKAFDEIRRLLADQPLARRRGYGPRDFSFNTPGGRCEACKGAGQELVEMVFLADVALECEVCRGSRYRAEILEVPYRGLNIRQILELTVDQAIRFFLRQDKIGERLWQLQRVGLGYLRLGQPATTLSGGEAQRLKVARELAANRAVARRLYILDEPTVGLGVSEVGRLVDVLNELVEAGGSVLVVEHNLEVIARADWVIDLGPEAAEGGGRLVATGPPERIAAAEGSHTGRYLRLFLEARRLPSAAGAAAAGGPHGERAV
ncbi:MAG: excinuclease ABC subunit UvrA [Gemmatimonadota bacterium]|nr:MAG: excinuclease ABC subunit UvrA [Gemmatimonadota bacterium]